MCIRDRDLADTVKYRQTLEENEKQLGNIRSGLELKLRSRKACLLYTSRCV